MILHARTHVHTVLMQRSVSNKGKEREDYFFPCISSTSSNSSNHEQANLFKKHTCVKISYFCSTKPCSVHETNLEDVQKCLWVKAANTSFEDRCHQWGLCYSNHHAGTAAHLFLCCGIHHTV